MKITARQAEVLENLHKVEMKRGDGKIRYSLDGWDCRYQIVGLAAHGAVRWNEHGKPSRVVATKDITISRQNGREPIGLG